MEGNLADKLRYDLYTHEIVLSFVLFLSLFTCLFVFTYCLPPYITCISSLKLLNV